MGEEITEEDFIVEPMEKVPKLTVDWCEEVAKEENKEEEENNKESQAEEPMEEDSNAKDDAEEKPEHGSVPYFRSLLVSETQRITKVCNEWEEKLVANAHLISEEIQGSIRSTVGQ